MASSYRVYSEQEFFKVGKVAESWCRIRTWLEKNAPEEVMRIQKPVEHEKLICAQELFEVELPADFIEL